MNHVATTAFGCPSRSLINAGDVSVADSAVNDEMPLASESTRSAFTTHGRSSTPLVILAAVALMLAAGNCCLKYLWWTACYSAWSGIPKMAGKWKAAGTSASFYGWSVLLLEVATMAVLCSGLRFRYGVRFIVSLAITITGTALSAWILSWIEQGIN